MKTVIVYDSVFGNTKKLASFVADAVDGVLVHVSDAVYALDDADLLLVGSPTRAFRPTPAVCIWLKKLPAHALNHIRAAAFDTRIDVTKADSALLKKMAKRFGYAASQINKLLIKKGAAIAANPEGFFVCDSQGPLADGELTRAADWARAICR